MVDIVFVVFDIFVFVVIELLLWVFGNFGMRFWVWSVVGMLWIV